MYRIVLYVLIGLLVAAGSLSYLGFLSYSPFGIFLSAAILTVICWVTNKVFAYIFHAPSNVESTYITALILALIISPAKSLQDFEFLLIAGVIAVASKYMLAIRKKHIFNPAAIAVVITGFFLHEYASWWVGTSVMLPFVVIGGFLVVKKLQRTILISIFLLGVTGVTVVFAYLNNISLLLSIRALFLESAIVFFATIMLTEPLTSPPTKKLQVIYGGLVALLIDPHIHVGFISSTPELSLVIANIFSYLVSPKQKLMLQLKEKIQVGLDQVDFIFLKPKNFSFVPGQYMEWTLQHNNTDSRGNRRYFTLASSPTEDTIHLGVKFYENGSSFKRALHHVSHMQKIVAGSLAGEFTLPKNVKEKIVFVAGGIGITPFRSMIQYLIDTKEKRDIVLLYSNKIESEIMYEDIFMKAQSQGVKAVYTLTDIEHISASWKGEKGRISPDMIKKEIPDYKERKYYLSGPHEMVTRFEQTLKGMGIHRNQIRKDFFPGFV